MLYRSQSKKLSIEFSLANTSSKVVAALTLFPSFSVYECTDASNWYCLKSSKAFACASSFPNTSDQAALAPA